MRFLYVTAKGQNCVQTSPCKCKICISSVESDAYSKKKIQMFVANMTFISSREVEKMYISFVPSALMKYTFFHFTRWNKSHIHSKHLNILYVLNHDKRLRIQLSAQYYTSSIIWPNAFIKKTHLTFTETTFWQSIITVHKQLWHKIIMVVPTWRHDVTPWRCDVIPALMFRSVKISLKILLPFIIPPCGLTVLPA